MAQTKKSSQGKKTKRKTNSNQQTTPPEPVVPIRREVCGVIFLFLALFTGVSYFRNEGAFICFFSNLIKGLVGWGYWLSVPAFFLCAFILLFHKGRPVALRVFCALLIPVVAAALISLFEYKYNTAGSDIRILSNLLFEHGQNMNSAGVFGGLLAIGLEMAFSIYGAFAVLLTLLIFSLVCVFRKGFRKAADKVKIQVTAKYDPSMYEDSLQPIRTASSADTAQRESEKIQRINRGKYSADIPLGDDDMFSPQDDRTPVQPVSLPRKKVKVDFVPDIPAAAEKKPMAPVAADDDDDVRFSPVSEADTLMPAVVKPSRRSASAASDISAPPKAKRIRREEPERYSREISEPISAKADRGDYEFPSMDLLHSSTAAALDSGDEILVNRERLESAIRSFGISASIAGVIRGPTVTRYDIELDQGVKLSKITNLAGDLALALGVVNVRIAPIPDKISTVGIEVPNKIISTVFLRDIIDTPKFASAKSKLSFALGKDISGEAIIGNISKLPHMLIAGTTGSGKSVCMNSLILSLLYKATPDEVKLIMIDPKMVELGVYNGIPHLYVPVVTDPKKAAGALQWSVVEMLKRYRLFSEAGVRDLENYNKHCEATGQNTMPRVVIVIDELADLMLVASKDVEESICRVAQMGRAAGMHLVIATQRPSADVITGLMKANIPSRIAFAVSSAMESRIILDQSGAEKLIGMGDMLFSPVGCGKPMRIQGAFVSDEEREEVIQFIKENAGDTQNNNEIVEFMNKAAEEKAGASDGAKSGKEEKSLTGYDEMLPQAVEVVLETKSCSVSMLQRRIKLGYSRAARIVDQMEELGVVGPYEGAKPRAVIVDREGWNTIMRENGFVQEDDMALASEFCED